MYIKLFENFLGYSEVPDQGSKPPLYLEEFTYDEAKLIGECLPKFDIKLCKIFNSLEHINCMLQCEHYDDNDELICDMTIIKYRDEWYHVEVFYNNYISKHYECDQFDGLKNFLSHLDDII